MSHHHDEVAVVLPTHNRKNLLKNCLDSLQEQTYGNYEIIVVDDGSEDGTEDMVNNQFPGVTLLQGDGDLWWTGSVNKGIRYALDHFPNLDYVLLLNDDTEVRPEYIENILEDARNHPKSIVGSLTVDIDNPKKVVWDGIIARPFRHTIRINKGENIDNIEKDIITKTNKLVGRGVIYPVQVFQEIGLFDERHFEQCGDTELPGRARLNDYDLIVSNFAIVKSHVDETSDINTKSEYRLRDFREKFFSIKSNTRLKYMFWYRWNTSKNIAHFIYSFLSDLIITFFFGFLRHVRRF